MAALYCDKTHSIISVSRSESCAQDPGFSQLPLSVTPPVWSSLQQDRSKRHVAWCHTLLFCLLQGLMGVEELPMPLWHPVTAGFDSRYHRCAHKSDEIKPSKGKINLIVFSWLLLSFVRVWQHGFMSSCDPFQGFCSLCFISDISFNMPASVPLSNSR